MFAEYAVRDPAGPVRFWRSPIGTHAYDPHTAKTGRRQPILKRLVCPSCFCLAGKWEHRIACRVNRVSFGKTTTAGIRVRRHLGNSRNVGKLTAPPPRLPPAASEGFRRQDAGLWRRVGLRGGFVGRWRGAGGGQREILFRGRASRDGNAGRL